jgi:hypothetical protein
MKKSFSPWCAFSLAGHEPIPKTGNHKNTSRKVGMFLAAQKPPHNTPQKPHMPPQTHHNFTTTKHNKIAKPPAKTALLFHEIFSKKQSPASLFSPSKPIRKAGDTACCLGSGIT